VRFLADESVDRQIVDRLRQEGYRVDYVAETFPGAADDVVLPFANQDNAILITGDKDFGELVFRQGRISPGIILIRLAGVHPNQKAEIVANTIGLREGEMEKAFTVISKRTIRIRRGDP
jgi:predicted nuclease of predicted toxin-antitoxin system